MKVFQGFTNYLTEQLHRGTLDVAFCGKRDNEPDIAYFPVKHCELALYVRDDHPLASRETITFGELNDVDLRTYRRGTPIGERVAKMLEEADVRGASFGYDDDVSMGSFLSYNGGNAGALMLDSLGVRGLCRRPAPGARRGRPGALLHGVHGLSQEARALAGRHRLHRLSSRPTRATTSSARCCPRRRASRGAGPDRPRRALGGRLGVWSSDRRSRPTAQAA